MEKVIKFKNNQGVIVTNEFVFKKLENSFEMYKVLIALNKKFPKFQSLLANVEDNLLDMLEPTMYIGTIIFKDCKGYVNIDSNGVKSEIIAYDFSTEENIEEFFKNDFPAYMGLVMNILGFIMKSAQG